MPTPTGGYSTRVAARLTQIEPETLRMWERRYGFPRTKRTSGGNRIYAEGDVETLLLVGRALKLGYRPGQIVGKRRAEIEKVLATTESVAASPGTTVVDSLTRALARDDLAQLRTELRQAALMLGPRRFLTDVAQPATVRVGEMWAKGDLAVRHEHMWTAFLSTELRVLASAYDDAQNAPLVLLATLPGDHHALGLEMVALYLALGRSTPRMLGPDSPPDQIVLAARACHADAVGIGVSASCDVKVAATHVRAIRSDLPRNVALWIGGAGASRVRVRAEEITRAQTWSEIDDAIEAIRRRRREAKPSTEEAHR